MDEKLKTPLTQILEWFQSLENEIQLELLNLCLLFHYDKEISSIYNGEEKRKKLLGYLDASQLSNNEIITRTLFMTQLFDFAFNGRDTEDGWDKTLNMNLDIRNRLRERGEPGEFIDNALKGWHHRKHLWISLAKKWRELKSQHLEVWQLDDWYRVSLN